MTIDKPKGFFAVGVKSGLKSNKLDLAVVRNLGPNFDVAGVFTTNEIQAAPVLWSKQIVNTGKAKVVILNSGGANACTGSAGFQVTHKTAEYAAEVFGLDAIDVAVCSTGIIGEQLNLDLIQIGIDESVNVSSDGDLAAQAILTTDSVSKTCFLELDNFSIAGMAKGAGMLAPTLATMLCVITTDADLSSINHQEILERVVDLTFNRISSDGCTSTNDTILVLASGASSSQPTAIEFYDVLFTVCQDLAKQIILDAEGATVFANIEVTNAVSENQALAIAKHVSSDLLVKTALFGRDPNWGRVAASVGAVKAGIDPMKLDIYFNDEPLCLAGAANGDRHRVDLRDKYINIKIDLNLGRYTVNMITTDLSTEYVIENSEYSS